MGLWANGHMGIRAYGHGHARQAREEALTQRVTELLAAIERTAGSSRAPAPAARPPGHTSRARRGGGSAAGRPHEAPCPP